MTPVPAKVLAAVRCIVDGPKPCPASLRARYERWAW